MCLNKHNRVSNRGRVNNYGGGTHFGLSTYSGGNALIKTGARMD